MIRTSLKYFFISVQCSAWFCSLHTHISGMKVYMCIPAVTKSKGDGLNRGPHVQADLFWSHFFNSVWADDAERRQNTHSQLLCIFLWLLSWHSHWFFWPLYHHGWWIGLVRLLLNRHQFSLLQLTMHASQYVRHEDITCGFHDDNIRNIEYLTYKGKSYKKKCIPSPYWKKIRNK